MRIESSIPRADVNEVLAQMRALRQAAQAQPAADIAVHGVAEQGMSAVGNAASPLQTFGAHLSTALNNVNALQGESSRLSEGLARGQHNDLVATMVASQQSSVAFQAATQVRNRLVTAYESIMNMPI